MNLNSEQFHMVDYINNLIFKTSLNFQIEKAESEIRLTLHLQMNKLASFIPTTLRRNVS